MRPAFTVLLFCLAVAASAQAPGVQSAVAERVVLRPAVVAAVVPPGCRFLSPSTLRELGPVGGGDALLGAIAPPPGGDFQIVLQWVESGHVTTAEAAAIDAEAVMAHLHEEVAGGNAGRRAAGWPELAVVDFVEPPRFDTKSGVLTFVWRGRFGDEEHITYDARKLTRQGVLVCAAAGPAAALAGMASTTNQVLGGLTIERGHRHEDYVAGDKKSSWATAKRVAAGVWERMTTWQKVAVGFLILSAALGLLRGLRWLSRRGA